MYKSILSTANVQNATTLTAGSFSPQRVPWFAGVELQQPENEYMWDGFEPPVVNGCSTVRALGATNVFERNHADMAGGAVYATEKAGLSLTCSEGLIWDDARGCPVPDWAGNIAGVLDSQARLSPLEDMLGYVPECTDL